MFSDLILLLALATGAPLAPEHAELLPELTPMAESIGMGDRGSEISDASFALLNPLDHQALLQALPPQALETSALTAMHEELAATLTSHALEGTVTSRRKSLYSTWSKMQRKDLSAVQVTDRLATRVLLEDVDACYTLLGDLHGRFAHLPEELDDYIARPKPNGYQSLHTVLAVPTAGGSLDVEVQLRTHAMHAAAEHGDAAHWAYKRSQAA